MNAVKYVRFKQGETSSWGILSEGSQIVDLRAAGAAMDLAFPARWLDFIQAGSSAQHQVVRVINAVRSGQRLPAIDRPNDVQLIAPIPRPAKNIFAPGLNPAEYVAESHDAASLPPAPIYFTKAVTAVVGPDATCIADCRLSEQLGWEVEFGVVLGAGGRQIPEERALEHVFGYTVIIELSISRRVTGNTVGGASGFSARASTGVDRWGRCSSRSRRFRIHRLSISPFG